MITLPVPGLDRAIRSLDSVVTCSGRSHTSEDPRRGNFCRASRQHWQVSRHQVSSSPQIAGSHERACSSGRDSGMCYGGSAVIGFYEDYRERKGHLSRPAGRRRGVPVRASSAGSLLPLRSPTAGSGVDGQTLEGWLVDAAFEIVSHLQEAPFLHLVFKSKERAAPQWRHVPEDLFSEPSKWSQLKEPLLADRPDGLILVHRLTEELAVDASREGGGVSVEVNGMPATSSTGPLTDWWGVVVAAQAARQHRCYVLKTTRVASGAAAGGGGSSGCTRFSITRAQCFGPELHEQMELSWLA